METNYTPNSDERLDEVNDDIKLIQRKNGLLFGTDALLLASYIKPVPDGVAAELGSGSGIISLLAATRKKAKHIDCVEIQPEYAELTAKNIRLNLLEDTVTAIHSDIRTFATGNRIHAYDIVFSNPPYMKNNSGKSNVSEEKNIARHEVHGNIADFVNTAGRLLKYGGSFYCVYRTDRLCDLICSMRNAGIEPKTATFVHAKADSLPSMVLIMGKSGGKPGIRVTPPLIMCENDGKTPTDAARKIYECGNYTE